MEGVRPVAYRRARAVRTSPHSSPFFLDQSQQRYSPVGFFIEILPSAAFPIRPQSLNGAHVRRGCTSPSPCTTRFDPFVRSGVFANGVGCAWLFSTVWSTSWVQLALACLEIAHKRQHIPVGRVHVCLVPFLRVTRTAPRRRWTNG